MLNINKENFYEVNTDTFQFNAGIIGFIYAMEANQKTKGVDYDYDDNTLYINKDLLNQDLASMYINAVLEKYADKSIVTKLLTSEFDSMDLKAMSNFDQFCKRKTVKNTCVLLKQQNLTALFESFSKEKDEESKRRLGKEIINIVESDGQLKTHILLGDIFFMKFSVVFNNFAFLKKNKGTYNLNCNEIFEKQLDDAVFNPLRNDAEPKKTGTGRCFQCDGLLKTEKIEMTFIRDCVADMHKKTSTFWNKVSDTYICPLCNMIYSFMPLGFSNVGGKSLVFVNVNDNIEYMKHLNYIVLSSEDKDVYYVTYNSVISKLVDLRLKHINQMQIIMKDVDNHYLISNISKDKFEIIRQGERNLKLLANTYVKDGENYINVYAEAINNIINGRNQFDLVYKLIKLEFNYTYKILNILLLQIIKKNLNTEVDMEKQFGVAYVAKKYGNELRNTIGIDADNKLRGFVYQLLNAVHSNNIELYCDRIIRMYVGMQKPIPDIFINGFKGEEEFKTIGYAYILGLKGEEINKGDKNNEK